MVVLVGIEGAGGNANNPNTGYTGSFVHRIVSGWPGPKKYMHGPHKLTGGIENVAQKAFGHAHYLRSQPNAAGIALLGYSRGGASAIRVCRLLEAQNIQVDCLALLDAIDLDPTVGTSVPSNVQLTVHAVRSPSSGSRPNWGNCGTTAPNTFHGASFNVTHWGASGVPQYDGVAGLPQGATLNTLVDETSYVSGNTYNTNIPWKNDIYTAHGMYAYVISFLNATYLRLNKPKSPGGGGGGGKRPGGGPGSGQTHTVAKGETLSLITKQYWQDMLLFPLIYDANASVIGGNWNLIQPGMVLTIPDKSSYTSDELDAARQRARSG